MKKFITALLGTALIATTAFAQGEAESKAILDKLSAKTKAYKTVEAKFTFIVNNKEQGIVDTTKGSMQMKGEMYHLKLEDQEIFCDGKKIYTYSKATNEAQVISVDEMDKDAVTPKSMFTIYEQGFKSKIKEEKTVNGRKITVIDLYPTNPKEKDYSIVRLDIDKEKLSVHKAMVLAKNGTHYIYRIDKMTPDVSMDDSIFIFDKTKYPKVTIIE